MSTEITDRRTSFCDHIADIVLENGLSAFALRGLAARLDTSGRMLLYYFGSKDVLVRDTLGRISDRLAAILAGHSAAGPPTTPGRLIAEVLRQVQQAEIAPFMRVWTEVVSAGARGETPFNSVAPVVVAGWVAWIESRLLPEHHGTGMAVAMLAFMDGITLLESASPGTTAAARALLPGLLGGVLDETSGDSHSPAPTAPTPR